MERIALKTFFLCMPLTATLVVFGVWFGESLQLPEWYFKIIATTFIAGLASFLTWFVYVAYRYLRQERERHS